MKVQCVLSHDQVAQGQKFHVAVVIEIQKGYVLYSPQPGGSSDFAPLPARLTVEVKQTARAH